MKFKQFISAIFFMATSENFAPSSSSTELETVLDYIGVKKLHEQGITGKGVKACIFDTYSKRFENRELYHSHGDVVSEYYERTAPESHTLCLDNKHGPIYKTNNKIIHSLEDINFLSFFKDNKIRIMNQSVYQLATILGKNFNREDFLTISSLNYSYKDNPLGCLYPEDSFSFINWMDSILKLTELGVVVTLLAGNQGKSLSTHPMCDLLPLFLREINENPNNPGAILVAGSSQLSPTQAYPKLAFYSNTAGIFKNAYLHVPTSLTYLEKLPEPSVLSNANSSIINKLFKFLPTAWITTSWTAKAWAGTSFAAPTISGMVALLMEAFPKATGKQIANLLLSTAQLPEYPKDEKWRSALHKLDFHIYGRGMPNAHNAYLKGLELNINDDRDVLTSLNPKFSLKEMASLQVLEKLPFLSL